MRRKGPRWLREGQEKLELWLGSSGSCDFAEFAASQSSEKRQKTFEKCQPRCSARQLATKNSISCVKQDFIAPSRATASFGHLDMFSQGAARQTK